jgi:hypothetical protein
MLILLITLFSWWVVQYIVGMSGLMMVQYIPLWFLFGNLAVWLLVLRK